MTTARRQLPGGLFPRLLNREQLAEYLQCSPSTVEAMVEDGLISEPQRWRGLVRWDRVSVDRVIDRVYGVEVDTAEHIPTVPPLRKLRYFQVYRYGS